jgi:Flp pilus assembly protein TadG
MSTLRQAGTFRKMRRRSEHGAELVEMAFVLPLLVTLLIGVFWAARAYNIYETITRAARDVENAVLNSLTASSINTTNVQIPSCTGNLSSKICYLRDIQLNTSNPKELGVSVSLTYPFQFSLPFTSLNMSTVNITTAVQMREEN